MSFNGSGTYVPPTGQPVTPGTVISSSVHNVLVTDIGNTFNNTLPRDGQAPMSAPLKVVDGTSSGPAIAFNSEPSTGLYRPAANTIALTAGGAEGLRLSGSGRVLLGTSTDNGVDRLQVNGTTSTTGNVGVGATSPGARLYVQTPNGDPLTLNSTNANGPFQTFQASGAAIGFVGSARQLVSSPATGAVADLTLRSEGNLILATNVNERLRINSDGNVSIGGTITSVGGYRSLALDGSTTGALIDLRAGGTNYGRISAQGSGLGLDSAGFRPIVFYAAGTEGMRMQPSGNLNVGGTGDQARLVVKRDWNSTTVSDSASIVLSNRNTQIAGGIMGGIFADTYRDVADPHYAAGMWFTRGQAAGNLSSNSAIVFGAQYSNSSNALPTEIVRISPDGNVGINKNNPTVKLHVVAAQNTNDGIAFSDGTSSTGYLTTRFSAGIGGTGIGSDGFIAFSTGQGGANVFNERARIDQNGTFTYGGIEVGYRGVPRATSTSNSNGKCVAITSNVTIDNTFGIAGTTVSFYNDSASTVTIVQGTGLTLRLAGTTVSGNRTIAPRGLATLWWNSGGECIASGAGVS